MSPSDSNGGTNAELNVTDLTKALKYVADEENFRWHLFKTTMS